MFTVGLFTFLPGDLTWKCDYTEKCQSNFAFWFAVVHVHLGLKVNIIIMWFVMPYSFTDQTKIEKYANFATAILIL